MKRLFILLSICFIFCFICASGYTDFSEDFDYTILADGTIEISKYSGKDRVVNIPSDINGYEVTSIGRGAFVNCGNLESISIPDSVKYIGKSAFLNCSNLRSINIPDGINIIEENTFSKCNIVSINIPNSVTSIGNGAFFNCTNLIDVSLSNGDISIGRDAFGNCSSLTNVIISNNVTSNKNPDDNSDIAVGAFAFCNCSSLTYIDIPNGATSINENAFSSCNSLTSVSIPDGVTSIGENAFFGCSNLASINFPSNVTSIGSGAFIYCDNLTRIAIPKNVEDLGRFCLPPSNTKLVVVVDPGSSAEDYCKKNDINYIIYTPEFFVQDDYEYMLRLDGTIEIVSYLGNEVGITIPAVIDDHPVKLINPDAFDDCIFLQKISIPHDSSIEITDNPFTGCKSLQVISVSPDQSSYATIDNVLFQKMLKKLICYPRGLSSEMYTIPNGIISIGAYSFGNCTYLMEIEIPNSITEIGDSAFSGCSNLSKINIPDSVSYIGENAFSNCSISLTITVERDSYAAEYCKNNGLNYTYLEANDWLIN